MKITLNGRDVETAEGASAASFLSGLKIELARSAVAVNSRVVPRSKLAETALEDGDIIEVIEAVGGG